MSDKNAPEIDDMWPMDDEGFSEEDFLDGPDDGPDHQTTEKIIDVYHDARKVLKPAIEKVREKVRESGVSPQDLRSAENKFDGKGDTNEELVRGIVTAAGEANNIDDFETKKKK